MRNRKVQFIAALIIIFLATLLLSFFINRKRPIPAQPSPTWPTEPTPDAQAPYQEKVNDHTQYFSTNDMFIVINTETKEVTVGAELEPDMKKAYDSAKNILEKEGYTGLENYTFQITGPRDYSSEQAPPAEAEIEKMYDELLNNRGQ